MSKIIVIANQKGGVGKQLHPLILPPHLLPQIRKFY
jgi:septum formation inhibitor-activating ATPase MinD